MVPELLKASLIGLSLNEAANNIHFKLYSMGNISLREFDSTNVNTIVKYIICSKNDNFLNVYSRNNKIFAVGKLSLSGSVA
jgi:hypothetical protein